jgi:hypothetical protein
VAVLAMLLFLVWGLKGGAVRNERSKARKAEAASARLLRQTSQLTGATALDNQVDQRRKMVQAALADDVAWTRVLQEISAAIPSDVWLSTFNAQKSAAPAVPGARAPATLGAITFAGMGFDHSSAARWLMRVGDIPSLADLWLSSSTKSGTGATSLVSFNSTANLTPQARSDRADQYLGEP